MNPFIGQSIYKTLSIEICQFWVYVKPSWKILKRQGRPPPQKKAL